MTTGRINQVTILTGRSPAEAGTAGEPPGGGQNRWPVGEGTPYTRPDGVPAAEASRALCGPSNCHPLSSPRRGPPQTWRLRPWERPADCDMHPLGGGYQPPVTP